MQNSLDNLVGAALAEDAGQGDITTMATIPPDARCEAQLIAKQKGVLSGMVPFQRAFELLDADLRDWNARFDGEHFEEGDLLATFSAKTRATLTGERVGMNFAQHLTGIATLTAAFVAAIEGFPARILDTRKTTPLLRALEKAAVAHGGGTNHRFNLSDGILIKDNHIVAAGGVKTAVKRARAGAHHLMRVEVEVTSLEELNEAFRGGAEIILLDNMDLETMTQAVESRNKYAPDTVLEASGNASLDRVRAMAETGVDFISVGALTHSAPAADLSLRIVNA